MPNRPQKVTKSRRSALKIEALEQRQLLAGVTGAGTEVGSNIQHPNGNIYDQVLMTGSSVTVTADPGQVTRVSFLDASGDIVQAEFGGAGSLTVTLTGATGPAAADKYNQPGVSYMKGSASFTIQGSDTTTNFGVFSVGTATANAGAANPIFSGGLTGGNNIADIQRITVVANPANANGSTFGGIRAGNALFSGDSGVVGIAAANVQVQDVVTIGDLDASGSGTPTLVFGGNSQFATVNVAGGDLLSTNGAPINNIGSYLFKVNLAAGTNSGGTAIPAATTASQISFAGVNPIAAAQKTFTLTSGVDTISGTTGDDIILGQIGTTGATLTPLDTIDGGGGNDQLVINDITGGQALPTISIKNVEALNYASVTVATLDTTVPAYAGLTAVNVLQSTGTDNITAGKNQAVTVFNSGGTSGGLVNITGGSSQTVITSGGVGLSGAIGAIKVTDTKQANINSTISGGTTVDVTTTIDSATSGALTIGGAGALAPTGAVTVSYTLTGDSAAVPVTRAGGAITVTGGSTIAVTETAIGTLLTTSATQTTQALFESAISITGSTSTASVTVNQTAQQTAVDYVTAVTAATEVTSVTFPALTAAGQFVTFAGLTYTATGNVAAKDVAAAFANLSAGATTAGTAGTTWTTGPVTGTNSDTVVFTAAAAGDQSDLVNAGGAVAATITPITAGASSKAAAGRTAITQGAVTIADANATSTSDTLATVSLSNYGNNTAGSSITSDALTSLTIGGNVGALSVTNNAALTLDLTLNKAGNATLPTTTGGNQLTLPTYTTIKLHTGATDNSTIKTLTTAQATAWTIDGSKVLTITDAITSGSVKTVTVTGAAGLTLSGAVPASVTTIDASATSGPVSVTLADPTATTYTGGTGADKVTLTANPSKAISGGAGTDTLTVNVAAATALANPSINANITGFETLGLGSAAVGTYDVSGFTGLTVGNITSTSGATLSNAAAGVGLTLTGNGSPGAVTYSLKTDTAADTLALTINGSSGTNVAAPVIAPSIETITINSTASNTTVTTNSLTLTATAATSITITGAKPLTLLDGGLAATAAATNIALTSVDGSAMTGALTYTAAGTVAETVKGGSGNDVLTASGANTTSKGTVADTLIGGAGNDVLIANAGLDTLTGGAGGDTFVVSLPSANVNTYSTVTDLAVGDVVRLGNLGTETFAATKVALGDTAVFQDYANAVAVAGGTGAGTNGYVGWFQFGGNTYVVESLHSDSGQGFVNGTDVVVKMTGLVDLSTATFLQNASGAPEIIVR